MYSALRVSLWLFKFGPAEFSPLRFIEAIVAATNYAYYKGKGYISRIEKDAECLPPQALRLTEVIPAKAGIQCLLAEE